MAMRPISRRRFFRTAGALSTLAAFPRDGWGGQAGESPWKGGEIGNATFRLHLSPQQGLRKTRLVHVPSGLALADADYSYSFDRPQFGESRAGEAPDGSMVVSLRGVALASLEVLHEFRIPRDRPWIEEQITLMNQGTVPLDLHDGRCGFVLPVSISRRQVTDSLAKFKFIAVPFRREPKGHRDQYADFSVSQIVTEQFSSELWTHENTVTPAYASEGWSWTDGTHSFLVTKYSQLGLEWALLDRVPLDGSRLGLRWGGYGIYRGDPEHGAWLQPGESHRFGVTRLTAYQGGIEEGFFTFRAEMAERGHGCAKDFNPPVHWNELYDNKLWWLPGDGQDQPKMRKEYYTLADMKEEAAKAKAIGCEALYQDPGWDTTFASKIWDEERLGSYRSFTEMLRRDYGLKSSLHTPLSGWCNPSSYPAEMYRMDGFRKRLSWDKSRGHLGSPLCGASRQYLEETARRLKALGRDGAAYFMFDGTQYHGECWDPEHGHLVPARRQEHVQALCRLARMVHAEYPKLLIEMHDPVVGGDIIRATPVYFGHGRAPEGEEYSQADGFDTVWAFELMWMPMEDLLSGRAIALYYYNLAYSLPLYIHIDLRTDNHNALVFWWNASTCRHLGIGGTHQDPAVQRAHKEAMATYRRLKPFFTAGTFYGVDETIHVHIHPTETAAVVNCFNLGETAATREVEFRPERYGLDPKRSFRVAVVPSRRTEKGHVLLFNVPARGHQLAEITAT